ncbi:MAG: cytochrome c oxidase cbb3-type subunit 4 [Gammaproteobacteria bacterium]|jgi:cytochrome c oxidase cbb3-type subunit 4
MTMNLFHSLWTIVVLVTFVGIIIWSYSKNRKSDFDEAARLALDDHLPPPGKTEATAQETQKREQADV